MFAQTVSSEANETFTSQISGIFPLNNNWKNCRVMVGKQKELGYFSVPDNNPSRPLRFYGVSFRAEREAQRPPSAVHTTDHKNVDVTRLQRSRQPNASLSAI